MKKKCLIWLLLLTLGLSACSTTTASRPDPEPSQPETEQTQPTTEPEPVLPPCVTQMRFHPTLSETVLPDSDKATGTLMFYLNGKAIHAGMPVAELLEIPHRTEENLDRELAPWNFSGVLRLQIDLPKEEKNDPYFFFVAVNAGNTPQPVSRCTIFSITVTCEKGLSFGSGREKEPFVSGVSTREEIVAAYGEPDEIASHRDHFEELFYYEPFSFVSFSFKNESVRQISACYSRNLFGDLISDSGTYDAVKVSQRDGYRLMNQYLDVTPYLSEEGIAEKDGVGILSSLDDHFWVNGHNIKFGCKVTELPKFFREELENQLIPMDRHYYMRIGKGQPEEFFLINEKGQKKMLANTLLVKGFITESNLYHNWGYDSSAFHDFNCQGVTQKSTIDHVLELFGAPRELECFYDERNCFAWMHYQTENEDILHIRVDPILNQVVEVQIAAHFDKERHY